MPVVGCDFLLRSKPLAKPKLQPSARLARPSQLAIQANESPDSALGLLASLEQQELFHELVGLGAIKRARFKGHIPSHRYWEHAAAQVAETVRALGLDARPEWGDLCEGRLSGARLISLAEACNSPVGVLRQVAQFMSQASRGGTALESEQRAADSHRGSCATELTGIVEAIGEFVSRYSITRQELVDFLLSGERTSADVQRRYGCTAAEARSVSSLIDRVHILDSMEQAEAGGGRLTGQPCRQSGGFLAAHVELGPDRTPVVHCVDHPLVTTYVVDRERLDAFLELRGSGGDSERLLDGIRSLNERQWTLLAVINSLVAFQSAFVASGMLSDLAPITQAELARRVGCARSTVCRLVRGVLVGMPHGVYAIPELMPGVGEVIGRLHSECPDLTDSEIGRRLHQALGLNVSRRLVNYHRRTRGACFERGSRPEPGETEGERK